MKNVIRSISDELLVDTVSHLITVRNFYAFETSFSDFHKSDNTDNFNEQGQKKIILNHNKYWK